MLISFVSYFLFFSTRLLIFITISIPLYASKDTRRFGVFFFIASWQRIMRDQVLDGSGFLDTFGVMELAWMTQDYLRRIHGLGHGSLGCQQHTATFGTWEWNGSGVMGTGVPR